MEEHEGLIDMELLEARAHVPTVLLPACDIPIATPDAVQPSSYGARSLPYPALSYPILPYALAAPTALNLGRSAAL